MVNWEDGQLVSPGYVEIDGVRYPIVEAEYEGNTPVSSHTLNKMQKDIIKEGIIVSPTEPTGENRRKFWLQKGKNLSNINSFDAIDSHQGVYVVKTNVRPNSNLVISCTKTRIPNTTIENGSVYGLCRINCYNSSDELLNTISGNVYPSSFTEGSINIEQAITTPENCDYIVVDFSNYNVDFNLNTSVTNIQIEYGTQKTEYESYIEDKMYVLNDDNVYEELKKAERQEINFLSNIVKTQKITTTNKTYLNSKAKGSFILIVTTDKNDLATGVFALSNNAWGFDAVVNTLSSTSNYYNPEETIQCGQDAKGVWVKIPQSDRGYTIDYTAILIGMN